MSTRTLIVEDNPASRRLLRDIAARVFHLDVDEASSVDDAKHHLDAEEYDLVLMDVGITRDRDEALVAYLREHARSRQAPVVAVTAHAMTGDRERILAAGFDGYVSKPYTLSSLRSEVDHVLSHRERHE